MATSSPASPKKSTNGSPIRNIGQLNSLDHTEETSTHSARLRREHGILVSSVLVTRETPVYSQNLVTYASISETGPTVTTSDIVSSSATRAARPECTGIPSHPMAQLVALKAAECNSSVDTTAHPHAVSDFKPFVYTGVKSGYLLRISLKSAPYSVGKVDALRYFRSSSKQTGLGIFHGGLSCTRRGVSGHVKPPFSIKWL
jgi:hypothetical protein